MQPLLRVSRMIDALNTAIGKIASWMVLLAVLISAGNALVRYTLGTSSNAWLEVQWYMFAAMFLLGAAVTLNKNEHVRVDIVYGAVPARAQTWIDLLGGVLFMMPMVLIIGWLSWPVFANSFAIQEQSNNAGGLIRWPVKLLMPVGFALLALQGVSEIIKRIAVLRGHTEFVQRYEKPLQ